MNMRGVIILFLLFAAFAVQAQQNTFPQTSVAELLNNGFTQQPVQPRSAVAQPSANSHYLPLITRLERAETAGIESFLAQQPPQQLLSLDTLIVGAVPNDTLIITGNWTHTGPIWVFNDGVLIFRNATVIDTGDVFVWGTGQLLADSSSLSFPQAYFYERSLVIFNQAQVRLRNCSLNYSGMSHYLGMAGNPVLEWTNVHNSDWTTASVLGASTVNITNSNLTGEYILQDSISINLLHADSVILWHQFPQNAVINYTFPPGDTLYNYSFNNTLPGISGINYNAIADSCTQVLWALMPVNGSDVTISNSDLRLIGCWFQRGDVASIYGVFNNSNYSTYTAPLTDRNLQLNNTSVETWSMYVFDSSFLFIDSCQFGEAGTQQTAGIQATNFILDGSGGYFWSTDSSTVFGINTICYTTCRSEKQSTFVLGYSWLPFITATAIQQSTLICVQNQLPADPVPYNGSVVWMAALEQHDTAAVNSIVQVNGSAWIDQGPDGNPTAFGSYSLSYQLPSQSATWFPVVTDSLTEIRHTSLAAWNTNGLQPGTYILKLTLKTAAGDTVDALNVIELMSNPLSVAQTEAATTTVYPNPAQDIVWLTSTTTIEAGLVRVYDVRGREVFAQATSGGKQFSINLSSLEAGVYFIRLSNAVFVRVVKE
jgi:hypothetical protein